MVCYKKQLHFIFHHLFKMEENLDIAVTFL